MIYSNIKKHLIAVPIEEDNLIWHHQMLHALNTEIPILVSLGFCHYHISNFPQHKCKVIFNLSLNSQYKSLCPSFKKDEVTEVNWISYPFFLNLLFCISFNSSYKYSKVVEGNKAPNYLWNLGKECQNITKKICKSIPFKDIILQQKT